MATEPRILTGGQAVAEAMRQIDPDVVPMYPITPQTPIIQGFATFVAQGRAHGELVDVESEHSAMSASIASALAGARTMTATSSQGLALMAEVVYIAASMRAPVVMALGNRALSGPINIHCDHSDSMLIRDSGAIQLFAENAQEAYDLTVIAPRLADAQRAVARCHADDSRQLGGQRRVGARRARRAAVGVSRQRVDRARLVGVAGVRRATEWRFTCGAGRVPPIVVRPRLNEAFRPRAVAHLEAVVMAAGAREQSQPQ